MMPPIRLLKSLAARLGPSNAEDGRGKRFVAVIECILNQNARDAGAARFPALNFRLLQLCHEYDVGILQMPCPEIAVLGWPRTRPAGQTIRQALDTDDGRRRCAQLAGEIADRIEAYVAQGCRPLAILGGNPLSPGCAVHGGEAALTPDSGVFMTALHAELAARRLTIPFKAMRDHDPDLLAQDLLWFREFVSRTPRQETEP
jgi:predicted secreted protein